MSEWKKKKQKKNQEKASNPECVTPVCNTTSVSKENPDAPVTGIAPMSLKRNKYQDDIFAAGAEKLGISKQQFIRIAALEYAAKLGIF